MSKGDQYYHKNLKMMYTVHDDGIEFQDGVFYSNKEIYILKNDPCFDYETIHALKKMFDAEVIE
jgi:hypothetical protein